MIGHFVGITGSARPVSIVNFKDGKLSFSIPPQWEEEDSDLSVEGTLNGDNLSGTMTLPNGKKYNWSAAGLHHCAVQKHRCGKLRLSFSVVRI